MATIAAALGRAWDTLDAAGLADGVLARMEGERDPARAATAVASTGVLRSADTCRRVIGRPALPVYV